MHVRVAPTPKSKMRSLCYAWCVSFVFGSERCVCAHFGSVGIFPCLLFSFVSSAAKLVHRLCWLRGAFLRTRYECMGL